MEYEVDAAQEPAIETAGGAVTGIHGARAEQSAIASTKIESLVEAIEDFSIGISVQTKYRTADRIEPDIVRDHVTRARSELRRTLRDFLRPALAVVR